MNPYLDRREFLKLTSLLPGAYYLPRILKAENPALVEGGENILVLVFDALSAKNLALYGYPRQTAPNLTQFAEKASVYHNHYAGGLFTSPGTASLLTGTYPWTHRAFNLEATVADEFITKNIFSLFKNYHRAAYSHNPLANLLFDQFMGDIDLYKHRQDLYLESNSFLSSILHNDYSAASLGWTRIMKKGGDGFAYSLFLSEIYDKIKQAQIKPYRKQFPRGIPFIEKDNYYLLEDSIDWLNEEVPQMPQPFLGYFHFFPPHEPYFTRQEFIDVFNNDGNDPAQKPESVFTLNKSDQELLRLRQRYDEYILYADAEFGRLYQTLSDSGALDNTWVIVTADHGELFERGIRGHMSPAMNQPVTQIPLLISAPGQTARQDIIQNTSAVDILPTLLHLSGQDIPAWCEGQILPNFSADYQPDRPLFALEAKQNPKYAPLTTASAMIVKGQHKLVRYFGYGELASGELVELYDLENDPEELEELSKVESGSSQSLYSELIDKLEQVDRPYRK